MCKSCFVIITEVNEPVRRRRVVFRTYSPVSTSEQALVPISRFQTNAMGGAENARLKNAGLELSAHAMDEAPPKEPRIYFAGV